MLLKLLCKVGWEQILPNQCCGARTSLIPKLANDTEKEAEEGTISRSTNTDVNIPNNILTN